GARVSPGARASALCGRASEGGRLRPRRRQRPRGLLPDALQPQRARLPAMTSRHCSRRELITRLCGGIASLAFTDLLERQGLSAGRSPLAPKAPHFPPKAKSVISIFCYGGVSQVDTFDPKPELLRRQGEAMTGVGEVRPTMGTPGGLMPSPWRFRKRGHCGMEISELFPHVAEHADDLALIRSMYAQ